ncbi:MAG: hypothetical protein RLN72_03290, partial [Henriciella sp.]
AAKAGFEQLVSDVKEIRSQANVAIDNVYAQADQINQRFYVVDSVADTVMQIEADANAVKAAAFYFMLSPSDTSQQTVTTGIEGLDKLASRLESSAKDFPAVDFHRELTR